MALGSSNFSFQYQDFVSSLQLVQKAIKEGSTLAPVVAYGPSAYLIERTCAALRDNWQGIHGEDDSYQSFEAAELEVEKLQALRDQPSLFHSSSLYLVKRCEKKPNLFALEAISSSKGWTENQWVFAFSASDKLPAKVQEGLRQLDAVFVPCVEPRIGELPRFIGSLAKKHGINLTPDAISIMQNICGTDLFGLESELQKLALVFAGEQRVLSGVDISPFLNILREDHAFELSNLILRRQAAKAQVLLLALLSRGESALAILGVLARHCRQALMIADAYQRRLPMRDVATTLRLPLSVANLYNEYVKSQPVERYVEILLDCQQADRLLKSSTVSEEMILTALLVSLT